MYNQLATPEEAAEIAKALGGIGGGVTDTYVPEYGGPFVPPENGTAKFLHFRFANGAEGFNVGLIRAFMQYSPLRWPVMISTEVEREKKRDDVVSVIPDITAPSVDGKTPPPIAPVTVGPDLNSDPGNTGRFTSLPGDTAPVGTKVAVDGKNYVKRGVPTMAGVSIYWELAK